MADDAHLQERDADPAERIREIDSCFCCGILPAPGHDPDGEMKSKGGRP